MFHVGGTEGMKYLFVSLFLDGHDGGLPPPRRPMGGGAYGGGGMEYNGQDAYSDPYNSRETGLCHTCSHVRERE